jgi:hypothetical protein
MCKIYKNIHYGKVMSFYKIHEEEIKKVVGCVEYKKEYIKMSTMYCLKCMQYHAGKTLGKWASCNPSKEKKIKSFGLFDTFERDSIYKKTSFRIVYYKQTPQCGENISYQIRIYSCHHS